MASARRICSDSGIPSRALTALSRRACTGSSLSEIMILFGTCSIYAYIRRCQEASLRPRAVCVSRSASDRGALSKGEPGREGRLRDQASRRFCDFVFWRHIFQVTCHEASPTLHRVPARGQVSDENVRCDTPATIRQRFRNRVLEISLASRRRSTTTDDSLAIPNQFESGPPPRYTAAAVGVLSY
jgi:hypothetical protein